MIYLEQELSSYPIISKIKEIIPSSFDGQWIWDLSKPDCSWISPSFYRLLNFSDEDIQNRTKLFWKSMFTDNDLERMLFNFRSESKTSLLENLIQLRGKGGNVFWVKFTGIVLYNQYYKPSRFVAFLEKKIKVHELESYFDLQRKANSMARVGTWEVNLQNKSVFWSQVTKEVYEVAPDHECNFTEALQYYKNPIYKGRLFSCLNNLNYGVDFDVELKIQTPNGKEKWVRMIGVPVIENGKCIRAYGLIQDIDDIKTGYLRLQEQEALFRSMFEFAAAAIVQASLDYSILRANFSLCELLGYSKEELQTMKMHELTHPEDVISSVDLMNTLKNGSHYHRTFEKRYLHKNGRIIWALVSISLVIDNTGKPLYFLGQIVDITRKKEAEARVNLLMNVTQNQHGRLLNFAEIVSHQLRSHTSDMEMILNLINLEQSKSVEDPYFPLMSKVVGKLSKTIDDLNEVITVHNTGDKLPLEMLNLKEFVVKVLEEFSKEFPNPTPMITVNIPHTVSVMFTKEYLNNIIWQLIDNAVKYKSPYRTLSLVFNVATTQDYYVLEVTDNGKGIDAEFMAHKLFKMYHTYSGHEQGRGLGLFLVKNQLEAFGGTIEAESELEKGSSFFVYFKK